MANNLTGYPATTITEAIFNSNNGVAFNPNEPNGATLAQNLFVDRFMPYAIANWRYDGATCNCEDLAQALKITWIYVKTTKRTGGLSDPGVASVTDIFQVGNPLAFITQKLNVFAGPARGNIWVRGTLDGKCLFPNHWVCKIGTRYFDPTFNRSTDNAADVVRYELTRPNGAQNVYATRKREGNYPVRVYAHNLIAAPQFSDSWNQMKGDGYMSSVDWKSKTSRALHSRSRELQAVDSALADFEQRGFGGLHGLQVAFRVWVRNNPNEAAARNVDNCVVKLGQFMEVHIPLLAHV